LGIHQLDEAERALNKAIELQPTVGHNHVWLAVIKIQLGNAPAALEAAQQEPPGEYPDMVLAFAQQVSDDRSAADSALKTLIENYPNYVAYQIAEVYALRNDPNG
jgi:adenylate cyclase